MREFEFCLSYFSPRKRMSMKVPDYCPINLVTSVYKIIKKVLSARLSGSWMILFH